MFRNTAAILAFLALSGLVGHSPRALADEDLYKSGRNLYIRLTDQDSGQPNQQPVSLDPGEISNALRTLELWDKHWFKEDKKESVFSEEQARLLGQYVAAGLGKASPTQDIVFALARNDKGFLGIRDISYTAGRIFYADDRLNVIIGDYKHPPDKFMEKAEASTGNMEVKYYFSHGKRSSASGFDKSVRVGDGVEVHDQGGRRRPDWIVLDVRRASAAYLAANRSSDTTAAATDSAASAAMRQEAEKLAQERREMRLEMARMRKEMGEGGHTDSGESVEARLKTLDELKGKKLITEEEYQRKRKEILNDI